MRKTTKIIAAGISTIALAGGIGVGIASADPSTSSPTPSASPTSSASPSTKAKPQAGEKKAGDKKHRDLTSRALHGEVTLGGKKAQVVVFQRGTVDKIDASSITVKSRDGFTATYVVTESTKMRKAKKEIAATDIKTDDRVRVQGPKDSETTTATRIVVAAK